jgi:hypothetical protein
MSNGDRTRYELHRFNGREAEVVRDLNGAPLSLRTATLLQERDRWSGTRSFVRRQAVRASGRQA